MKDINKRVGLNIRRTRENAGLSQERLAALADLHRAYIGQKNDLALKDKSDNIWWKEELISVETYERLVYYSKDA